MRAKRSKKYRKIMSAYNMHFSFRTPYQVLCSSDFLRTCHAFHMPVQKYLESTLHGDSRPYITQCSLASIMKAHERKFAKSNNQAQRGRGDGKPMWLPLPEEVPLRYCKHKDDEGEERGVISEEECLLDLVSGQVRGNEMPRNKQHYILATAETEEEQKNHNEVSKKRRGVDIREKVRIVPGVPIIYVKRSVMVLEEMSGSSERIIKGIEKEKFKEGLVGAVRGLKRKRDDNDGGSDSEDEVKKEKPVPKAKGPKGPNPLSVKKKKPKPEDVSQKGQDRTPGGEQPKKKNRRKRGKKGGTGKDSAEDVNSQNITSAPVSTAEVSS